MQIVCRSATDVSIIGSKWYSHVIETRFMAEVRGKYKHTRTLSFAFCNPYSYKDAQNPTSKVRTRQLCLGNAIFVSGKVLKSQKTFYAAITLSNAQF